MWPVFLLFASSQTPPAAPASTPTPRVVQLQDFPTSTARGAHFQVTIDFESQAVADAALAAAESVVTPAATIYGPIEPRPVDTAAPIEIHITSSPDSKGADWTAIEAERFSGANIRTDRRSAWLGIDPPLGKRAIAAAGLPGYMRVVIAREAVHLLAARASPDPGSRLDWFDSGAASWAAEEGLTAAGFLPDRMEEPALATDALTIRRLAASNWLPSLEAIVTGLPGGLTKKERPVVAAFAFRFLHDHPAVFARMLEAARSFDGTSEGEAGLARALGIDDERAKLEAEFAAAALALVPQWEEVFPALTTSGTSWLQSAALETNAIAWRTRPVGVDRYVLEGEVEILPGKSKQMNVLLARGRTSFLQVAFVGDYGIDVLRFDNALEPDRRWAKLATVEVKGLIPGKWIPFRLEVAGSELAVIVRGQAACAAHLEGLTVSGAWGLGALADAAGRWRKIAISRL